jgi:RimJ/RimL family protein N-acetyltransferase
VNTPEGRVLLRPMHAEDIPRIVEACSDTLTAKWLGQLQVPYTAADATALLEASSEGSATGNSVTWAVAEPESNHLLGTIGLYNLVLGNEGEVGYWMHPGARSQGTITAACRLTLQHGFSNLGLSIIRGVTAVDNTASRRVLERSGLTLSGIKRGGAWTRAGHVDAACYDITAQEVTG